MVQPLNHSAHGTVRPVRLAGCHTGQHLLGQIDVVLTSTGDSYSESQSWTGLGMGGRQGTYSQSTSESENASMTRQDLFSANDMRALDANHCLLIGNIGDRAADEVLQVAPLYIN